MNRSETGMSSLFLSPQHEQRRYSAGEPRKKLTANLSHSLSLNETNACNCVSTLLLVLSIIIVISVGVISYQKGATIPSLVSLRPML